MPCPHFKITIVKRSQGQSAVAGAAYQSGERLFSEYDQKTKFYNKKKELVHAEIMLPSHAPPGFADRATLWNAVEAVENQWNSQLARRIVLAFPVEVPKERYLKMIRVFCQEQFVSKGMIADFAIHDKGDGNPHAHILLTIRAMDEHGKWLPKARKVYDLDENGERIRLPSGNWKCHKENTVDWNDQKYAEVWRHGWETITNRYLEAAGRPERVDLRSFERQGLQQIPTVHLGPAAHQMEKRGIETFLGNLNRDIRAANSLMQSIRSAICGLQRWIADLNEKKQLLLDALEKAKEPTLSDLLMDYFNLRNEQRSDWSGKAKLKCTVRDFEEVKRAVDYLKAHSLNTVEDLNQAIDSLNQTAAPLRGQLKQNENRMRAIAQIKDAAAVHAKLKPIHDIFNLRNKDCIPLCQEEFAQKLADRNEIQSYRMKQFQQSGHDCYLVMQLHQDADPALRFAAMRYLNKQNIAPSFENYEILYRGNLPEGKRSVPQAELLEQLYQKFNCARPTDYHGHSLSVSDVIMLNQNGKISAHYVDSIGFKELPGFLDKQPERHSVLMNLKEKCDAPECNPSGCKKRSSHEL
ncbi:MAG: MobQ family relaxase [Faecalibacterium prausnitzii]